MNNINVSSEFWLDSGTIIPIISCMFPSICFNIYDVKQCTTSTCKKANNSFPIFQSHNYMKYPCDKCVCLLYNGENHYGLLL